MLDDLLVVGFDLETQREVHIGDRPLEQWRTLGYGRRETVVCFYCWHGIDAPAGTKVPLLARGRIGGLVRPHFAHPAGMAPPRGHHRETVWHINAKNRLARWAAAQPNVAQVRMEQWTEQRNRRADVHVVLDDGARLALEAQRELITDELWQARHRDYAAAGVRDVWFMRPDTRIPHVLFAEGTPAWTLYHRDETAEARLGAPRARPAVVDEGPVPLRAAPPAVRRRPGCSRTLPARRPRPGRRRRDVPARDDRASGRTGRPRTVGGRPGPTPAGTGRAVAPRSRHPTSPALEAHPAAARAASAQARGRGPFCEVCNRPLAEPLVRYGRHVLC
ncbi:competence protein CoiA family protein [Streptomyces nogalater]